MDRPLLGSAPVGAGAVGVSAEEVVEEALVPEPFAEPPLLVDRIPQQRWHDLRKRAPAQKKRRRRRKTRRRIKTSVPSQERICFVCTSPPLYSVRCHKSSGGGSHVEVVGGGVEALSHHVGVPALGEHQHEARGEVLGLHCHVDRRSHVAREEHVCKKYTHERISIEWQ